MSDWPGLSITKWDGPDYSEEFVEISSLDEIAQGVMSIRACESATVSIEIGKRTLIIGASEGIYTATALLDEEGFWDKLSPDADPGSMQILLGGQTIDMPKKFAISCEQAIAAAEEFCLTGTTDVAKGWRSQDQGW